jgi:NADH-quinone oxidoreductase subunit H
MVEFFTENWLGIVLLTLAQCLLILVPLLVALAFLLYADRKIWAAVQMRRGPTWWGPSACSRASRLPQVHRQGGRDPRGRDKAVFLIAPLISFVVAVIAWAVIPFNDTWVLADINVAILYVSRSRRSASTGSSWGLGVELEVPVPGDAPVGGADDLLRGVAGPHHHRGHHLDGVDELRRHRAGAGHGAGIFGWYWVVHFPMVFLFFISALAETNRRPSTFPRPNPSSWRATRWNTPRRRSSCS